MFTLVFKSLCLSWIKRKHFLTYLSFYETMHSRLSISLPFLFFQRGHSDFIRKEQCLFYFFFVFAKQLFSQITLLFEASDNILVSWGTEPSVYLLPASHSIQPPFNYRAGHNSVFPHHTPSALRPSFNDEASAQGGLDICFIIIILHLIFGTLSFLWSCMLVCQGVSLYMPVFVFVFFRFFFFHI